VLVPEGMAADPMNSSVMAQRHCGFRDVSGGIRRDS
jgi:hypothetical protein